MNDDIFNYLCSMTTRQWTKLLNKHPIASTIEINGEYVKGKITVTRHRILNTELVDYFLDESQPKNLILKKSEIDVTFKGSVKASSGIWHSAKSYNKRALNNWFRKSLEIKNELKLRLKLIGGSSDYKIKKITLL